MNIYLGLNEAILYSLNKIPLEINNCFYIHLKPN